MASEFTSLISKIRGKPSAMMNIENTKDIKNMNGTDFEIWIVDDFRLVKKHTQDKIDLVVDWQENPKCKRKFRRLD